MKRVELLAPAGDLEKLKVALLYGADAVYIGGTEFSLRARASKFTLEMIEEGVRFAHQLQKKVYITTNIIPYNEDLGGLEAYLKKLEAIGVDAIIGSSPYILATALKTTNLEVHLSTQQSVMNSAYVNHWFDQGITRVVLGREVSLEEIKQIEPKSKAELEVFIHGGMCVSYSGKCTLSNTMAARDANRGGCAHSCRWRYALWDEDQLLSEGFDFHIASKDLQTLRQIPALIDANVASLKIEGRMKSIHYIAIVVSTYRQLIDDYYRKQLEPFEYYEERIAKAENRDTSSGLLLGKATIEQQLYQSRSEYPNKEFIGIVKAYDPIQGHIEVEQRNYFAVGDLIEVISPRKEALVFEVKQMKNALDEEIDVARHPLERVKIPCPLPLQPYDLLRRIS